MRLVTNLVKNMNVGEAVVQLSHLNKKAALMLSKVLKSAVANAKNNFSMDPEKLFIKSVTTDMGKVMKRYMARARGSAFVIRRKTSHVNVVLEERKKAKPSATKFTFLKKKGEEKPQISSDQKEATSEKLVKEEGRKSHVFKTDEQLKMNKIQQKRRLFDRRGGE
jgi:large subunit ribosomal protein L22